MTMDGPLLDLVVDRLAVAGLTATVEDLVIAACEGQSALDDALGGNPPERPRSNAPGSNEPAEPRGAYLTSLTVEGFRGIGPALTVDFTPGPGLTVVAGRNGSGKSSLAEAFEILLTGENQRWQGHKAKVWQDGWRNLRRPDPVRIAGTAKVQRWAMPGPPRPRPTSSSSRRLVSAISRGFNPSPHQFGPIRTAPLGGVSKDSRWKQKR